MHYSSNYCVALDLHHFGTLTYLLISEVFSELSCNFSHENLVPILFHLFPGSDTVQYGNIYHCVVLGISYHNLQSAHNGTNA